jgi:uncharacterized membrane protein YGL010W
MGQSLGSWLQPRVDYYGQSHRHPVNMALHFIGIPLLTMAGLGLFAQITFFSSDLPLALQPNVAWLLMAVTIPWYLWTNWKLGLPTVAMILVSYFLGTLVPLVPLVALFVFGVVIHFIGHFAFEGRSPSFLTNPLVILDAPTWMFAVWAGIYRAESVAPEQPRSAAGPR